MFIKSYTIYNLVKKNNLEMVSQGKTIKAKIGLFYFC